MSAELLLSVSPGEVRAALLEDDAVVELLVERPGIDDGGGDGPGAIHLGRVTAVVESLNAAFVDIGGGSAAFLPASAAAATPVQGKKSIASLVHEGEAVLVQVTRAGAGDKGPKATRRLTLAGHRLVLRPGESGVVAGRRLADPTERTRLTAIMEKLAGHAEGFILRTAAAGADMKTLKAEVDWLRARWQAVVAAAKKETPPALLDAEPGFVERILRDHLPGDAARIVLDGRAGLPAANAWCRRFRPDLAERIEIAGRDLFAARGVEAAFDEALAAEVALPSGGTLAIEPTRALTAIDVDTGQHAPAGGQARALLATNLEAAAAVARQLRLRNIGGLVAVDFVHMREPAHRRDVAARPAQGRGRRPDGRRDRRDHALRPSRADAPARSAIARRAHARPALRARPAQCADRGARRLAPGPARRRQRPGRAGAQGRARGGGGARRPGRLGPRRDRGGPGPAARPRGRARPRARGRRGAAPLSRPLPRPAPSIISKS